MPLIRTDTPIEARDSDNSSFEFGSTHTENFPRILKELNISLAVTSYQAGRLILLCSNGERIETHFKRFPRPMGVYADDSRLTLGTLTEVLEFRRNDRLLHKIKTGALDNVTKLTRKVLEKDKEAFDDLIRKRNLELAEMKKSDSLYISRASLTTGMINIHDIAWGNDGLWVVNSTFSCLSTLSTDYSFIARWRPHWITELVPEDRCHLNGMAMKDGRPRYVTTFNKFNERDSWKTKTAHDGTLMDIDTDTILLDGLIQPHSPRCHNGSVYLCDSGTGRVMAYHPYTRRLSEIIKLQGFTRGLAFYGPLMFAGTSRLRASDIRRPIPISKEYETTYSGITVVNLSDNSKIAHIHFQGDIDQIYDIAIIPGSARPGLLDNENILTRHLFDFQEAL